MNNEQLTINKPVSAMVTTTIKLCCICHKNPVERTRTAISTSCKECNEIFNEDLKNGMKENRLKEKYFNNGGVK